MDAVKSGTESVRISSRVMKRLRRYLTKKYGGRTYGKITEFIDTAIIEHLDRTKTEREKQATYKCRDCEFKTVYLERAAEHTTDSNHVVIHVGGI